MWLLQKQLLVGRKKPLGSFAVKQRKSSMDKNKTLLFGALIGAFTGLVAAMILQRRAEKTGTEISLSTGEGIQLGVMVMGLLCAIASLGDGK